MRQSGEASTANVEQESSLIVGDIRPLTAIRAIAVMVGGSVALVASIVGGAALAARSWRSRTALGRAVMLVWAIALLLAYALLRRWHMAWGATPEERRIPLPGDELVPHPAIESTRAIGVEAPVEDVWPWLAQIGQDRGGFYSYEWLENLAGCKMRNADRIHPEWQYRAIGDRVMLHPNTGCRVVLFEPGHALALENWGAFVVEPSAGETSRVILRSRMPKGFGVLYYALLIELPHFIMERGMLLGIKQRAEAARVSSGTAGRGLGG